MFNNKTLSIIKRELKIKLFSKSFILMTLLIPLLIFGALGIQTFVMTYEGSEKIKVVIVTEDTDVSTKLRQELEDQPYVKSGWFNFEFMNMRKDQLSKYLEENKSKILEDQLSGVMFIPSSSLTDKKIEYYSRNPKNQKLFDRLREPVNNILLQKYFAGKQLSDEEIKYVREKVDFTSFRVSTDESIKEEGFGNTIVAFLFTFLLYISLIIIGTVMMRSVVEEKSNRIVEVLLSSLDSKDLMTGKIIGTAITGLIQMAIWLLPLIVLISTTYFTLPEALTFQLSMRQIFFFLYNYFIAMITFLGLYASVGAIFDNDQDAQSGMWPVTMLIMIPFFIAMGLQGNAENQIAKVASMFPFASLIIMPARISLIEVPTWQFIVAIIVNIATMIAIFPVAGKIYRVGILMTGKKPTWGEVIKWLKVKN